jgi:hypothetical protein
MMWKAVEVEIRSFLFEAVRIVESYRVILKNARDSLVTDRTRVNPACEESESTASDSSVRGEL